MTALPLDKTDLTLLDALQEDLPLVHDPWTVLGERHGITREEVLTRLLRMREGGILRGIAPILESTKRKAGVSTLVAIKVPEGRIAEIAEIISGYPEVSHNFRRECKYNLWFTLGAETQTGIDEIISDIITKAGIDKDSMLNLKTVRRYKIDLRFPLLQDVNGDTDGPC